MLLIVFWVIAFLIACGLFTTIWAKAGPKVYAATKSHALQVAAMLGIFIAIFLVFGAAFSWLLSFFESA